MTSAVSTSKQNSTPITSPPTLIKYIKEAKYGEMFLIEYLNDYDIGRLRISHYKDRDWVFLRDTRIRIQSGRLVSQQIYELEIKERKWDGHIVRTYFLTPSEEHWEKNNQPKYFKTKKSECLFTDI